MQKQQHPKCTFQSHLIRGIFMSSKHLAAMMPLLTVAIFLLAATSAFSAESGRETLSGHVPSVVAGLTPKGRLPATNNLYLAIGLPLRNHAALDALLQQLYDPASTNYHKFLDPQEFTVRFGPTEADYAAVRAFAEANG